MTDEEFRYVKLESDEARIGKRDVLSAQMSLLKILGVIKNYHALRIKELKAKTKMYSNAKELNQNIKKIKENIPKLATAHSFVKDKETGKIGIKKRIEPITPGGNRDLEIQLREIQEKLRALQ